MGARPSAHVVELTTGLTQTGQYCTAREDWLRFRKFRDYTIYIAKAKAMISCTVTVQLICVFVLAYAKSGFT